VQRALEVLRGRPRDRSKPEGLAGRLKVSLRTCSKSLGDGYDSYLHVGSGMLKFTFDRSLLEKVRSPRRRVDLESFIRELAETISIDYALFSSTRAGVVVPGSSVKGNVRSRLELSFVPKEGVVRACFVRSSPPTPEPKPGQQGWRHYRIWRGSLEGHRPACTCVEGPEECEVCLLCDIFGTAGLKGLVSFSDFVGVGISTVKLDLPYNEKVEAALPGSRFSGEVYFFNLKPEELGLILFGMGLSDSRVGRPVLLGKLKYRRDLPHIFGVVRYELEGLELAPFSKGLEVGSSSLAPGSAASGEKLDPLVKDLVGAAKQVYAGELVEVDEVGVVGSPASGV